MTSVVLSIVGGAIGGPVGAAIGSLVGAWVDSRIIASMTPTQRIEGPRLDSLRFTTATEGAVIPRVFGAMRLGGNIIWATDFREEWRRSSGGGKGGGGGVTVTEYFYYCSFAVALCEGPIAGIGRIWADGKPFDVPGALWRLYRGSEEQMPDPLIESAMGAGNVPAYRGTAYIVFENLPLEKFGNRIPQLSFEIFCPLEDEDSAGQLIRSVNMIPGAGEFVYATSLVSRQENGVTVPENIHSTDARPDFLVSLDQLEAAAPDLRSISLVVAWFGTDLRCGQCKILPGVETSAKSTVPFSWSVNGATRADAHVVSEYAGGPAYGGTPADFSVAQAIAEIRNRGHRVTFYPFLLMDIAEGNSLPDPYSDEAAGIGQPAYPWRGRITCSPAAGFMGSPDRTTTASAQVAAFFGNAQSSDFAVTETSVSWIGEPGEWGYRRMILHYAHLCAAAGGVDSFLIGSELRALTQIRSSGSDYPAVAALRALAADVRLVLGTDTAISYAADWSEYFGHQPQDGSGDVHFHLDPLWADDNIDFIGIDNYMPLSDWRDGFEHADAMAGWRSVHELSYLQANVEGGEGFDWHYPTQADRDAQNRVAISDGLGRPWVFRYKDIRSWWSNPHYDRPGGIENATPTAWVAQSKPIRFTELGCPAADRGSNQPNAFIDPKSAESALPHYSRGARDDFMQRRHIEAVLSWWTANNPVSANYGGPMLDLDELSVWAWDARPYPAFPGRPDVWGDCANWQLGHWLNGRLGASGLGSLVKAICRYGGLEESQDDISLLAGSVSGYVIDRLESARASIEPLARYFGFDAVESGGLICFVPRGLMPAATLPPDELVAATRPDDDDIEFVRAQETELPLALKWRLLHAGEEYGAMTVEARRIAVQSARIAAENFALSTAQAEADAQCRRALFETWLERESGRFALPPSRLALDPADVVLLEHDGRLLEMRLAAIADQDARNCEAVRTDAVLYGARPGPERLPVLPAPLVYGQPVAAIMDLPIVRDGVPAHRPWAAAYASPWYGRAAVWRSASEDGFAFLDALDLPARMGILTADFYSSGAAGRNFDLANELHVQMFSGTLASVTDLELFAGANAAAIESPSGVWEIVQFATVELTGAGYYRCTRLLRGQMGSEDAMGDPAPAGSRFIMLDSSVQPLPVSEADLGIAYNWRIGPVSQTPDDDAYLELTFTSAGIGLRPWSVCHVAQPWRTPREPGDLTISWRRRTRSPAGDSWTAAEAPLFEDVEAYEVDIFDGEAVLRTLVADAPSAIYTAAQQIADHGALLGPGDSLDIAISQISPLFGRGVVRRATLFF